MKLRSEEIRKYIETRDEEEHHIPFFWDVPGEEIPIDPLDCKEVIHLCLLTWMEVCKEASPLSVRLAFRIGSEEEALIETPPQSRQSLEAMLNNNVYPEVSIVWDNRKLKKTPETVSGALFERESRSKDWPEDVEMFFSRDQYLEKVEGTMWYELRLWLVGTNSPKKVALSVDA